MLGFDGRDLLGRARAARFTGIELGYRTEVDVPTRLPSRDWDVLKRRPNPPAPTVEEATVAPFTEAERRRCETRLRELLAGHAPALRAVCP